MPKQSACALCTREVVKSISAFFGWIRVSHLASLLTYILQSIEFHRFCWREHSKLQKQTLGIIVLEKHLALQQNRSVQPWKWCSENIWFSTAAPTTSSLQSICSSFSWKSLKIKCQWNFVLKINSTSAWELCVRQVEAARLDEFKWRFTLASYVFFL